MTFTQVALASQWKEGCDGQTWIEYEDAAFELWPKLKKCATPAEVFQVQTQANNSLAYADNDLVTEWLEGAGYDVEDWQNIWIDIHNSWPYMICRFLQTPRGNHIMHHQILICTHMCPFSTKNNCTGCIVNAYGIGKFKNYEYHIELENKAKPAFHLL